MDAVRVVNKDRAVPPWRVVYRDALEDRDARDRSGDPDPTDPRGSIDSQEGGCVRVIAGDVDAAGVKDATAMQRQRNRR